jgi:hypothetical protein
MILGPVTARPPSHILSREHRVRIIPFDRLAWPPTGAADGPHPASARRVADVKHNRDTTVHGGRTTGSRPGAGRDEQGAVTA